MVFVPGLHYFDYRYNLDSFDYSFIGCMCQVDNRSFVLIMFFFFIFSGSSYFEIKNGSNNITCKAALDYETQKRHTITIIASDGGYPTLSSQQSVYLDVIDINDNPPMFTNVAETLEIRYDTK